MLWFGNSQILTRKLPAETAHNIGVKALRYPKQPVPLLPVKLGELELPIRLDWLRVLIKMQIAIMGLCTWLWSGGGWHNHTACSLVIRPRVFRLAEDEAVINRYGFNGKGMAFAAGRLQKRKKRPYVLGVNIGANKLRR